MIIEERVSDKLFIPSKTIAIELATTPTAILNPASNILVSTPVTLVLTRVLSHGRAKSFAFISNIFYYIT